MFIVIAALLASVAVAVGDLFQEEGQEQSSCFGGEGCTCQDTCKGACKGFFLALEKLECNPCYTAEEGPCAKVDELSFLILASYGRPYAV